MSEEELDEIEDKIYSGFYPKEEVETYYPKIVKKKKKKIDLLQILHYRYLPLEVIFPVWEYKNYYSDYKYKQKKKKRDKKQKERKDNKEIRRKNLFILINLST